MSGTRAWIAVLAIGNLVACSSTLTQISPTQPSGAPTGRVGPFLNSPFFLTIVGSLAVGGITQIYRYVKAKNDPRKLAEDNARREKQTALLSTVANDMPIFISTMGSMKKLQGWLKTHPESDEKDDLGRPRDEVLREYTEFFKLFLKTRNSESILTEVGSFYEDKEVCDLVNEEDLAVGKIHDAKTDEERTEALKAEEGVFESLLTAMATEIRQTGRKKPFRRIEQFGVYIRRIDRAGVLGGLGWRGQAGDSWSPFLREREQREHPIAEL